MSQNVGCLDKAKGKALCLSDSRFLVKSQFRHVVFSHNSKELVEVDRYIWALPIVWFSFYIMSLTFFHISSKTAHSLGKRSRLVLTLQPEPTTSPRM